MKNNIKNYGIACYEYPFEKIYEIKEKSGRKLIDLFNGDILIWKGITVAISQKRLEDLNAPHGA